MQTAILLFENVTALDAVGPYEVLSRWPGAETVFVGERRGSVRTDTGRLALHVDAALKEVTRPDIVVVPGGFGQTAHMSDGPVHGWLRAVDRTSTWTTSVCTGSLILAAAGLLAEQRATHWLAVDQTAGPRRDGRERTGRHRRQVRHRCRCLRRHRHGAHPHRHRRRA